MIKSRKNLKAPGLVWYHVHYNDFTMSSMASQIISLTIVYSIVYSDADQSKHQSSASLAFVRGIHQRPVNSPHKGPVTRKMVPFDYGIMWNSNRGHGSTVEYWDDSAHKPRGFEIIDQKIRCIFGYRNHQKGAYMYVIYSGCACKWWLTNSGIVGCNFAFRGICILILYSGNVCLLIGR